ncbi:T-complex 11 [Botryosphaeria dothidea]|uniref:T-complex 11 n=1 Tax=Botryosphaeria dothidea TaxID=55169 RepID=A0A8H4J771_9PEZI|nr:T-complex 11 [Botryosphaeria dothidea]
MTADYRKGLEPQGTNPDRRQDNMASQTQDKSRRGSTMSYTGDSSDQPSLRYSSVPGTTADRTARVVQQSTQPSAPAGETYHRRPELMNVRRKRSGSEFREEGFCDEEQDTEARKAIALEAGKTEVTDAEILSDLCQWIEMSAGGSKGARLAHSFAQASSYPPITKHSLSELDIGAIINNPKLRHDVNFDRELHFRPNFDGAKGKFKLKTAEEYWNALAAELELYNFLFNGAPSVTLRKGASWPRIIQIAQRRIPLMFDTIREIIKSLVPERDQSRVEEQLDTKMLMQQIQKGVCDLVSVAKWLSHLLKAHCAPVRDEWVDKMVEQIDFGTRGGSGRSLVNGLRELLGILEAMKLFIAQDVANHQIRHLRALLIEDTINFEQKYHLDRIARRRILVERSQCWFAQHAITCRSIPADRNAKDRDRQGSFPETFYLDFDRLRVLRAEFRDQVYLGVATDTFKSLLRRVGFTRSVPDNHLQALREAVSAIVVVNEVAGTNSNQHWLVNIDNIAVEIVRHALMLCGAEANYNAELVDVIAERLRYLIRPEFGMVFHEQASAMRESLTARVMKSTESFVSSSPVDIFNALINSHDTSANVTSEFMSQEERGPEAEFLDDIARRVTHIAVLHWRIWGSIVYSQTAAFASLMRNPLPDFSSACSSVSSSSTVLDADASAASWTDDGFGASSTTSSPGPEQHHIDEQQPQQRARRWSSVNERRPATTSSADPASAALSAPPSHQGGPNEQPEDPGSGSGNASSGLERLVYRQR